MLNSYIATYSWQITPCFNWYSSCFDLDMFSETLHVCLQIIAWPMWSHSLAFISLKQNGSQQKQNDDFIVPIICYKVDNRAKHCYFQIYHGMNFYCDLNIFLLMIDGSLKSEKRSFLFMFPNGFFSERFLCMVKEIGKYQLNCVIHETITTTVDWTYF